ncbi:hypothetical protein WA026_009418, partial [Henosepilachna vigintioctopunctata]
YLCGTLMSNILTDVINENCLSQHSCTLLRIFCSAGSIVTQACPFMEIHCNTIDRQIGGICVLTMCYSELESVGGKSRRITLKITLRLKLTSKRERTTIQNIKREPAVSNLKS